MTSNALVPVFAGTLAGQPTQLCNARDLHATLEVGRDFSNWIKERIEQYGFVEGEDFSPNLAKSRGRPRTDYHLTLDMAKELAMVENNDKGRMVRRYFIRIEKEARAAPPKPLPAPIDKVSRTLRQAINRKAHEITVKQYDTIHAIITAGVEDNMACGAKEEDCFRYVETYGNLSDGTVVCNIRDLHEIVWGAQMVINQSAIAIASLRRIEQRTGLKLAHRIEKSKYIDPDYHKNDQLVDEVIDRMAGKAMH